MDVGELIIVAVAATAGSISQGCTGIGFGLIAGPALVAVDADFAPGPMLAPTLLITGRHVIAEWSQLDRDGLGPLWVGAPVGLAGGLVVLDLVSDRTIAFMVGGIVVAAAVAVLAGVGPRRTRPTLVVVGAATSFTGVTAGLPGPPMTIGYHDAPPSMLRSTGSLFGSMFIVAATTLLVGFGEFGGHELELAVTLVPPILLGLLVSRYLRPLIDATVFRPVILVLAGLGGAVLILGKL